jgi:hypothetical protein
MYGPYYAARMSEVIKAYTVLLRKPNHMRDKRK